MSDPFAEARQDVWFHARRMREEGLVAGSAGNVSRRAGEHHIAITPTSISYEQLRPEEIAIVELSTGRPAGSTPAPSYELPMHRIVYRHRADVAAIVHTHAPFVTTLSVLRRPLPPVIDEMLLHLGGAVEVSDYAFTGTDQVGLNVVAALGDRAGVILANHGNVCVGPTLDRALHAAIVMEACARVYVQALQAGEPLPIPRSAVEAGLRMYDGRRR
ncbi:MAG TPA: class II aldolase/adducin family protein [Thermoanaerobaculia bacterium]|nr:class II aldolase/adducin family protein [Thermoanaerobaculia bacterium]